MYVPLPTFTSSPVHPGMWLLEGFSEGKVSLKLKKVAEEGNRTPDHLQEPPELLLLLMHIFARCRSFLPPATSLVSMLGAEERQDTGSGMCGSMDLHSLLLLT